MVIVVCTECGKNISSHAPVCSHCGFQMGVVSEEQLGVYQQRKLRDRVYHLNMISYLIMTIFLVAFGWFWWDSRGFEQQSSAGPFILMGLAAVAYLLLRVLLFRTRQQQKKLRKKRFMHTNHRQGSGP